MTRLMDWELEGVIDAVLEVVDSLPEDDGPKYIVMRGDNKLVAGYLDGKRYDGHGKPYRFTLEQAKRMAENFGFTYEPAP